MPKSGDNAETDSDLLWGAIAGLRRTVSELEGRVERLATPPGPNQRAVEEAAEAWRAERQAHIDRLLAARGAKGDAIDAEDEARLSDAWMLDGK